MHEERRTPDVRVQVDAYPRGFKARYYPDDGDGAFGTIALEGAGAIYFHHPADVRALIATAEELERQMLDAQQAPVTGQPLVTEPYSPTACLVDSGHGTVCISRVAPHPMPHRDISGREWEDAAADATEVIAESIAAGTPVIVEDDELRYGGQPDVSLR